MKKSLFEYTDYKTYIAEALNFQRSYGPRSRLAEKLRCNPAFISRVLNTDCGHLSLEHGMMVSDFFSHTDEEAHYFMLLLQRARAGSRVLEDYFQKQINEIQQKRQIIAERIQVNRSLGKEDQMTYYSAWYYSAIHMILLVPEFQTRESIAAHFGLSIKLVSECLDFLVSAGLAVEEGRLYKSGQARLHLTKDSPMISKHHTNWRIKSIQSLERPLGQDLHFSGPICISERDAKKITAILIDVLEKTEPVIRGSKEENVYCLSMDFFKV